jgi:hypothetical protein
LLLRRKQSRNARLKSSLLSLLLNLREYGISKQVILDLYADATTQNIMTYAGNSGMREIIQMNTHKGSIRLSHSALDSLHTCERKFQLDRLLVGDTEKEDFPATVLGHSFGAGVAAYLITQSETQALYEAWLRYYPILEDDKRKESVALNLLNNAFPKLDNLLLDYEVATLKNGKPAVELSFRLNINGKFYYVGYIDVILRNKYTGMYAVMENKTTALNLYDLSCMYANSGQALGYSIILDAIAGQENSDYEVLYFVGQLGSGSGYSPKIHTLPFPKTLSDRLNWFITLQMDVQHIEQMLEMNVFPMRGHSCLQYMRPCKHFSTCQLHSLDSYKEELIDEVAYDFVYEIDDVIANHLERTM